MTGWLPSIISSLTSPTEELSCRGQFQSQFLYLFALGSLILYSLTSEQGTLWRQLYVFSLNLLRLFVYGNWLHASEGTLNFEILQILQKALS